MVQTVSSREAFSSAHLLRYMDLFVGRSDDFAVQTPTGRYVRTGRPLTRAEVLRHLRGQQTCGTYLINKDGECRFCVFDDDTEQGLRRLADLQAWFLRLGYDSYLEPSRRGGHLWLFFDRPLPASQVRAWLRPYCAVDMEFYPKQDEGGGYGSLIRLPLGLHRLAGRRYPFVQWNGNAFQPVTSRLSMGAQLDWLSQVRTINVPPEWRTPQPPTRQAQPAHQSFAPTALVHLSSPSNIRAWCAMQDPFKIISTYIPLNERGMGCCPFSGHHKHGEDRHPSFKVYEPKYVGGSSWYCYTWDRGGDVFDFLCLWYNVNATTMWRMIQAGEV